MALETWSPSGSGWRYGLSASKPEGEGWQLTGYSERRIPMNPNRMGSGYKTERVPIYSRVAQQAAPAPAPAAPAPPAFPATPTNLPVSPPPQPQGPTMADVASQFSSQIQEMQRGFMESMQAQTAQFQQMQAAQQERMEALQQQMLQAQIQQQQRPEVVGVKTATGSAGTPMQIARRGTTGTFARSGMRIKGLNV